MWSEVVVFQPDYGNSITVDIELTPLDKMQH